MTVLLRIGQHFQRLYASDLQPVLLSSLLPLHSPHAHATSTPVPCECPVQQILVWCDDLAARWSATRPALPDSGADHASG